MHLHPRAQRGEAARGRLLGGAADRARRVQRGTQARVQWRPVRIVGEHECMHVQLHALA